MNKETREAIRLIVGIASNTRCEDLHHKKSERHEDDFVCPVEYKIQRACYIVEQWMEDNRGS